MQNFKIWNIQIQRLIKDFQGPFLFSRTFRDLFFFQGLSRAWNFFSKIQGLSKTSQGPYEPWAVRRRTRDQKVAGSTPGHGTIKTT